MNERGKDQAAQARTDLGDVGPRLAALGGMSIAELREEFLRVYGFPTRSRNRNHLCKRVAWKIQADAEGGLSQRALDRIEQLAPLAPVRWRPSLKDVQIPEPGSPAPAAMDAVGSLDGRGTRPAAPLPAPATSANRDKRLPPAGCFISREYRGQVHQVRVLAEGFEYDGGYYASLSKVAAVITGTNWNGFIFFKAALEQGSQGRA
jgi:hypothetical protein